MQRRLDGIWGPRYSPEEIRTRRLEQLTERILAPFNVGFRVLATVPWRGIIKLSFHGFQLIAVLTLSATLVFGLIHPAVSQGIDLVRLVKPGRYLVAFLNSAELRPSGGFLGSFAIAHYDGKKVTLEVETNLYKHDNAFLADHFVPLPKPLETVWPGRSMSLVNANTAADFAESAQMILSYYQAEYGEKLDGVVGLTVLPVIELMELVGPVELPEHNVTLTAQNFLPTLHRKIQVDYFADPTNRLINEPKTILADLVAQMPERLKKVAPFELWRLINQSLKEKNLLLYFYDTGRQALAEAHNWAGALEGDGQEYLAIYHANYGGGKTSLEVSEQLKLEKFGDRARQLTITRTHSGGYDEFTVGENRNYTEVYLPKGSQLSKVTIAGIDITAEVIERGQGELTSYGFWLTTQPRSSQVAEVSYQLPAGLKNGLTIQKQPGAEPSELTVIEGDRVVFSDKLRYDLQFP